MKEAFLILNIMVLGIQSITPPKRVVTFNTGLRAFFDTHKQNIYNRTQSIIGELIKLDADVCCLQETWFEVVERNIVDKMKAKYPYSFSALHADSMTMKPINPLGSAPCAVPAFPNFFRCMLMCGQSAVEPRDVIKCCIDQCGLLDLPHDCVTCLSTHAQAPDCAVWQSTRVNRPGLLMLSKYDIKNPSLNYFHPDKKVLIPHAYIEADIDGLGKTICAHLAGDLGSPFLESRLSSLFHSYEKQNLHQVNELINVTNVHPQVTLMGCLNTGPAVDTTGVSAEFPLSYQALMDANFTNTFVDEIGTCTYCTDNGYVTSNRSLIIDHVLTRGLNTSSPKIVLNQPFVIQSRPHKINNPMSDHYAVQETIG